MSDLMPPQPGPPQEPVPEPSTAQTDLPAPPTRRPRGLRALVIAIVVVAIVLVGGAAVAFFSLRGAPETILDKVPSGADVVVVAHLDPAASQKVNLFRMADRFPALGSREQLTQRIDRMLDGALSGTGLTHEDLGWVGGEVGGYVDVGGGDPSYAVMLASKDDAAADRTLEALRADAGTTYTTTQISGVDVAVPADGSQPTTAIVNGVVVIASDQDVVRSVIDTANGGASVEGDGGYQAISQQLPQDNLGTVFVNVADLSKMLASLPGVAGVTTGTQQLAGAQAMGMAVSATSQGLSIDMATTTDPSALTKEQRDALAASDGPNPSLQLVPKDAFAVAATGGVTTGLESSVEQMTQLDPELAREIERLDLLGPDGLLSHLSGDLACQVGPGRGLLPVSGTVMLGVDDASAVEGWVNRHLPKLLASTDIGSITWSTEDYNGTTVHYSDPLTTGIPIAWGVTDRALVVGLSTSSVEQAVDLGAGTGEPISANPTYQAAVARLPGTESVVFVDVQDVLSTVKELLPGEVYQGFLDEGGVNAEPITVVVAGTEADEHGSRSRLLIEIP